MTLAFVVLVLAGAASGAWADCDSHPSIGLCKALIPRYFYNATSGQCENFIYGGCGGNANNYESVAECESTCTKLTEEECSVAPETGMCKAAFRVFYFDKESGSCKKFIYGGCGGNKNKFFAEDECHDKCGKYASAKKEKRALTAGECYASAETGKCLAYIPRFYFNAQKGQCEQFIYGGCGGNSNNFGSLQECNGQCGIYAPLEAPASTDCTAEPEVGLCDALIRRVFWNHRTGRCQNFNYGGCGGNTNNFATTEQCEDACKGTPVKETSCDVKPETGLCQAYFPSYFYNITSGKCESFVYGGCGGNSNRFRTFEACHATCNDVAIPVVDERLAVGACAMPVVVGPCRAGIPRFYYDVETQSCQKFLYGGCQGNDNNFRDVESCHNTCIA